MKYLWAPWRMDYILEEKKKGCIFCKKPMEKKDKENLILFQSDDAFVIMNKFPYNNGHLMVVPKRHRIGIDQLSDEEFQELSYLLRASTQVLKECLHPHGFNIGMNIGLLPVTGIALPFMSYGGSHLISEFMALGILMGMRRYRRTAHREDLKNEFLGIIK